MSQAYPTPKQGQAKSREEGGKTAPAGLWVHPETGNSVITTEDPLFGNAQSQAFLQAGFVFERPAEPEEIHTLPQLDLERRAEERENLKGLNARLEKLEGVADENRSLQAEVEQLRAEKAARDEADAKAAEEAAAQKAADEKAAADKKEADKKAADAKKESEK